MKHFKDCVQDRATIVDLCDMLVLEMHPSRPPCQLVLLDAGIIAELQSADLENFRAVFRAVVLGQVRSDSGVAWAGLYISASKKCITVVPLQALGAAS